MYSLNKKFIFDPSKHVMLDLETAGTRIGSSILSIGACTFNGVDTFYEKINHEMNVIEYGLTEDKAALDWWDTQPAEIRDETFSGTSLLAPVLIRFFDWFRMVEQLNRAEPMCIWGNGADFDQPMLSYAYARADLVVPWSHRGSRCFRTLKELYPEYAPPVEHANKHNALSDAEAQAAWASQILLQFTGE